MFRVSTFENALLSNYVVIAISHHYFIKCFNLKIFIFYIWLAQVTIWSMWLKICNITQYVPFNCPVQVSPTCTTKKFWMCIFIVIPNVNIKFCIQQFTVIWYIFCIYVTKFQNNNASIYPTNTFQVFLVVFHLHMKIEDGIYDCSQIYKW